MKKVVIFTFLLMFSQFGYCEDSGKDILKTVLDGFDETKPLIIEAQKNADRQDRFRFAYHYLYSDINVIKRGISSAVWGREIRNYKATNLFGDYGFVGKTEEAKLLQMFINELQFLKSKVIEASIKTKHENNGIRKINFNFITADINAVIGKIQNALAGSGSHARKYPALRGSGW